MEAAVFNLQMTADVNGNDAAMDAELEVKKLQELVRKLERQNEQLRTRANAANHCTSSTHLLSNPICTGNLATGPGPSHFYTGSYCISSQLATDGHCPCFYPQPPTDAENNGSSAMEDVEILDLRFLLPTDGESEDSWLYVSPKAKLHTHLSPSPLQWCRHVLDKPTPEVELAKRSLCYRLDQAKRWRGVLSGYGSSSVTYSPMLGPSSQSTSAKCLTKPALTEQTAPSSPPSHSTQLQLPLPGRSCSRLAERSPSFLFHTATHSYSRPHAAISPQSSMASDFSMTELDEDCISMNYKLQDMTDVQVMARLQEESLRQEYATTSATCARRSSSFSVHSGLRRTGRNSVGLEEDEEDDEEDVEHDELPPPQPRLHRAGSMQRSVSHSYGLSGPRDPRRSPSSPHYLSSLSSPSPANYTPPAETQGYRASTGQHTDKLRRSMPNLIRAPSMLSVSTGPSQAAPASHSTFAAHPPSSSSLRNSQSFDSSSGLARLQSAIPSAGQLQQCVQSIASFSTAGRPALKATAYVSPTIQGPSTTPSAASVCSLPSSGIPLPSKAARSALPRPASFIGTPRSKITQPARSLLTPPKTVTALSTLRDASWKDGCY
ncbi:SLAIN motif-containing protein 1a isoform X2 [Electrophorus electricus]|uniref:SLAIN motif-containing protein 1a isoform X2 n=1 Tax=Electrophorus electricus TaxID=8005 RepID=UPI0015CFDED1|nr:SLAIN motif-containing protein 1a isoform X2 [Electrophorus electricus]